MYTNMDMTNSIEPVFQKTEGVLEGLAATLNSFQLPLIHTQLDEYKEKLASNNYQVLIVGVARRGKSSLVNALIGHALIPTDVNTSTCQLFRIRRAEDEAYRLLFVDGSTQEISASDMAHYGSEVMVSTQTVPGEPKIIQWIEIDTPARFLPANVSIFDTPGLGSLFALHDQVTQRFLPLADAVIFVLDSNQPILQQELEFLEVVLGATSNILFVQTKIDQQKKEDWEKLLRRNEEILRTHFGEYLPDVRIWPISNVRLLKANMAEGKQVGEDCLRRSGYEELSSALQSLLFRAAGWRRAWEAMQLAENYHELASTVLQGRLVSVGEEASQQQAEIQRRMQQRKQQFDADWGAYGHNQEHLKDSLHRITRAAKRTLRESLRPGGTIESVEQEKITALTSLNEAKQYNATQNSRIINATLDVWRRVHEQAQQQCDKLFAPFVQATLSLYLNKEIHNEEINVTPSILAQAASPLRTKRDWTDLIKSISDEVQAAYQLGTLFNSKIAIIITAVSMMGRTLILYNNSVLEDAREQLRGQLIGILEKSYAYYFEKDSAVDEKSLVEDVFDSFEEGVLRQIQLMVEQASRDMQGELDRLAEEAKLNEQQRRDKLEHLQEQIAAWQVVATEITEVQGQLKMMDEIKGKGELSGS